MCEEARQMCEEARQMCEEARRDIDFYQLVFDF